MNLATRRLAAFLLLLAALLGSCHLHFQFSGQIAQISTYLTSTLLTAGHIGIPLYLLQMVLLVGGAWTFLAVLAVAKLSRASNAMLGWAFASHVIVFTIWQGFRNFAEPSFWRVPSGLALNVPIFAGAWLLVFGVELAMERIRTRQR